MSIAAPHFCNNRGKRRRFPTAVCAFSRKKEGADTDAGKARLRGAKKLRSRAELERKQLIESLNAGRGTAERVSLREVYTQMAIKNGDKQEALFCREVIDLIEIPEEVAKDHKQNTQGGVMALITNTYGRVEITCDWLGQASDEEIAQIQKSQAEFTQWKYYD